MNRGGNGGYFDTSLKGGVTMSLELIINLIALVIILDIIKYIKR